jgi:16S rRNA (guanine527-N7)-methyltransferase
MQMEKFNHEVEKILNIRLNQGQLNALSLFERELLDWNERFNLTAIRDSDEIHSKHFLDSLSCVLALNGNRSGRLIDVGTGAGFPGIPLKIALPQVDLTLVESIGKKAEFCRHVVSLLQLEHVTILQKRVEELGQNPQFRESYDWAVARAVANLNTLAEYLLPLLKVGGLAIAQKGESGPLEAHKAEKAIRVLGGRFRQLLQVHIPGVAETRYLVVIDKIATTPATYPRRVGIPSKKPIH